MLNRIHLLGMHQVRPHLAQRSGDEGVAAAAMLEPRLEFSGVRLGLQQKRFYDVSGHRPEPSAELAKRLRALQAKGKKGPALEHAPQLARGAGMPGGFQAAQPFEGARVIAFPRLRSRRAGMAQAGAKMGAIDLQELFPRRCRSVRCVLAEAVRGVQLEIRHRGRQGHPLGRLRKGVAAAYPRIAVFALSLDEYAPARLLEIQDPGRLLATHELPRRMV
jgi:hypothetical protein